MVWNSQTGDVIISKYHQYLENVVKNILYQFINELSLTNIIKNKTAYCTLIQCVQNNVSSLRTHLTDTMVPLGLLDSKTRSKKRIPG